MVGWQAQIIYRTRTVQGARAAQVQRGCVGHDSARRREGGSAGEARGTATGFTVLLAVAGGVTPLTGAGCGVVAVGSAPFAGAPAAVPGAGVAPGCANLAADASWRHSSSRTRVGGTGSSRGNPSATKSPTVAPDLRCFNSRALLLRWKSLPNVPICRRSRAAFLATTFGETLACERQAPAPFIQTP